MSPSLTDTLCTHCALCCDGSLFADVELASSAESTGLEIIGLEVEDGDGDAGLLSLPCSALRGRRCGIYAHRPECCRTFECGLLQDVRSGAVSVQRAQEHIAEARSKIQRVNRLLTELGDRGERLPLKERCAEMIATAAPDATPAEHRKRAELEAEMAAVERIIWTTFLGSGAEFEPAGR